MAIISKKTRYALHGLAYVTQFAGSETVAFDEILAYLRSYSSGLTLSPGYIAKIFQEVSRAGIVEAVSGPRGGYRLARPPGEIRLIDVVEVLDGPVMTGCCLLAVGNCSRQGTCGMRSLIFEAEQGFYDFLCRETLASLSRRMDFGDARPKRSGTGRQTAR